jgi:hypothetical protein
MLAPHAHVGTCTLLRSLFRSALLRFLDDSRTYMAAGVTSTSLKKVKRNWDVHSSTAHSSKQQLDGDTWGLGVGKYVVI